MNQPIIKIRESDNSDTSFENIPDILQRIYKNRGINEQADLEYGLDKLPSPVLMKSNVAAGKLLADAIQRQDKLLIVADFDVDGATSCALMVLALQSMGALHVDYLVPDRCNYKRGYKRYNCLFSLISCDYALDINKLSLFTT